MWFNFYHEGGFGMYPTTVFGLLLLACGVVISVRPQRRFVPLILCFGAMTLGSGLLGLCVGLINTFHFLQNVPAGDQGRITALGCAESLNNIVLALVLMVLTAVLAAVGAFRARWREKPEHPESKAHFA